MNTEQSSGLRVVLDTNVYVSAFNNPDRPINEIWQAARRDRYTLLVSPAIIRELASVLRRAPFVWDEDRLMERLRAIARAGTMIVPTATVDVITVDPTDNRILECAIAGDANLIVSGDRHLLQLGAYEGIPIIRPIDFLRTIGV